MKIKRAKLFILLGHKVAHRLTAVGHHDLLPPSLSRTRGNSVINAKHLARDGKENWTVPPSWAVAVPGEETLECCLCAQRCVGARAYYEHMRTHAP